MEAFDQHGWHGYVAEDCRERFANIDDWLRDVPHESVVASPGRDVLRYDDQGEIFYVKIIRALTDDGLTGKDLFSFLKWVLRPSRAKAAWRISKAMLRAGFACPEPVLAVRRRIRLYPNDILITREIAVPDAWKRLGDATLSEQERRVAIAAIAKEAARFHAAGFVHGDFLLRNICVTSDGKVAFLDNDRSRRSCLASARRNLEQLGYSLLRRFNSDCYLRMFFDAYSAVRPLSPFMRRRIEKNVHRRYRKRLEGMRKHGAPESEWNPSPLVAPVMEDLPPVSADLYEEALSGHLPKTRLMELLSQGMLLRGATSCGNADAYVIRLDEDSYCLVKTLIWQGWMNTLAGGGLVLGHEFKVLRRLKELGINFAPRPFACLERHTLLMEFLGHTHSLKSRNKLLRAGDPLPPFELFEHLEGQIRRLHECGIAHGDMRRANILIHEDGIPRIVDWATANLGDSWWSRLVNGLQRKSDSYSLYSMIRSYYPEAYEREWEDINRNMPWLLKAGRWLRKHIYGGIIKPLIHH